LYNASGLSAVEFTLTSGKRVSFGTAEPDALAAAVEQATGKQESAHEMSTGLTWGPQQTFGAVAGVLAVCVAGAAIYFGFKPPNVIVGFDSFYVSNSLYRNVIRYDSIQSLTLENGLPPIGMKTNGFAAKNTLRGDFRVGDWGSSRLFVNLDAPPFIVVHTKDRHVVVNFKNPDETRRLYSELRSHMRRTSR
jgi:hypothetical protein